MKRTVTMGVIAVLCGMFVFLCGCRAESLEVETQSVSTTVAGTTYPMTTNEDSGSTTLPFIEPTTQPVTETTVPTTVASTKPASADYVEWTYRGEGRQIVPGYRTKSNLVTYTENPENPYIVAVSKQLSVPADRFSASFYDTGAVVFEFSSSDKNADTLVDCHFVFSNKMEIEKRRDGSIGNNKALAVPLYERTMMKKP